MSGRKIYQSRRIAQQSVKRVGEATQRKGVTWEDVGAMSEKELYCLLFPEQVERV